ncbi:hypothetical protein [Nostoc sp.]|uniref:hypothetical protein n=1 Tax=Nostoc sp. TaxID=1180 RepID=UPI002FFD2CD3
MKHLLGFFAALRCTQNDKSYLIQQRQELNWSATGKVFNQNCVRSGMKSWQSNISLMFAASVVGIISILVTQAAWAEAKLENRDRLSQKGIDSLNQQVKAQALGRSLTKGVKQGKKVLVLKRDWGEGKIRQLSDFKIPITNVQPLLVQTQNPEGKVIPITAVKANFTDKGVEIILETPLGTQLQVSNRSGGNNFIADVSGGQLRYPKLTTWFS